MSLSSLSGMGGAGVRALEQGYSLQWEDDTHGGQMGKETWSEEPSRTRTQQDHLQKIAQERWLRKRAHGLCNGEVSRKTLPHTFGNRQAVLGPPVLSPLAAGLGYKCFTPQTSAHLLQVEAHKYPQSCILLPT